MIHKANQSNQEMKWLIHTIHVTIQNDIYQTTSTLIYIINSMKLGGISCRKLKITSNQVTNTPLILE